MGKIGFIVQACPGWNCEREVMLLSSSTSLSIPACSVPHILVPGYQSCVLVEWGFFFYFFVSVFLKSCTVMFIYFYVNLESACLFPQVSLVMFWGRFETTTHCSDVANF